MSQLFELQIGELPLWRGDEKAARVAYERDHPIIIAHSRSTYSVAADLLQAMALQLWATHAPGDAIFTLYEARPSPLFAHIKRVLAQTQRALGVQVLDGRVFSKHLSDLLTLAHQRFALLANSGVESLAQYNKLPHIRLREKVHYVLVSEMLTGTVREEDLQTLENLCSQGCKVGIIPLLLWNTEPAKENRHDLGRNPLQSFWQSVAPLGFGFDWSQQPPQPVNQPSAYWRLFSRYGFEIGVPDGVCKALANQLVTNATKWKETEADVNFLDVPVGHAGNVEVRFQMGEGSLNYHALLIGATGSGKTTLLHNVLLSACEKFTPEQLRLWIIDPKGTEFSGYKNLAHVDFLHLGSLSAESTEAMRDVYAALTQFEGLIRQRTELFQAAGVKDITEYNKTLGSFMPYCIFVVDEAPELLNLRQWLVLPNGQNFLDRIALKGRSFGLHLILLSQSFADVRYFPDTTKDSFTLRIAGKVGSESISRNFFGFGNEAAAHLNNTKDVRMAIVNSDAGRPEANQTVHLHNMTKDEKLMRLEKLRQKHPHAPKSAYTKPCPPPETAQNPNGDSAQKSEEYPDFLRS